MRRQLPGLLAEVFGIARGLPEILKLLDLMLELIGGQVLGKADFALSLGLGMVIYFASRIDISAVISGTTDPPTSIRSGTSPSIE